MIFKKLLIGASIAASVSAIASTPAFAGTLSNPTLTGSDYILYDVKGNQTYNNPNASLSTILTGDSKSPTGNVELFASSETSTYIPSNPTNALEVGTKLNKFKNVSDTVLSGTIGGNTLSLSSLDGADWFTTKSGKYDTSFGADNLANSWFSQFITKAAQNFTYNPNDPFQSQWIPKIGSPSYNALWYNTFLTTGGFQRASDPNISYVNQDDSTGQINIGLAGHYDMHDVYSFAPIGFQASEVVKYTYNGKTDYLYSFSATKSGLTEQSDGKSHSGNYEVSIAGVPPKPASTPEPSLMLGLLGMCGLFATQRQLKKAQQ